MRIQISALLRRRLLQLLAPYPRLKVPLRKLAAACGLLPLVLTPPKQILPRAPLTPRAQEIFARLQGGSKSEVHHASGD